MPYEIRAAASRSPIAVRPPARRFGEPHVPDASITASARSVSGPLPFWYRISKGAVSRPLVFALSKPARPTAVTRLEVRITSHSAVFVARGSM